MAKESGLGMSVVLDNAAGSGQTISNDITSITFSTPRGVQDITGLDKSAIERLLLLKDGQCTINGVFNDASNQAFAVLSTMVSSDATRTLVITVSGQILTMEMVITDLVWSRAQDGSFTFAATLQLANGTAPAWST